MQQELTHRIRNHPQFAELVTKRTRLGVVLSLLVLTIYFAFIGIVAFAPSLFGQPIGDGVTTLGIPVGIAIIVFAFVLTGIYVMRANSEFDDLNRRIIEETL